ncbi:MAG: hypothetical protein IRZ33_00425 [Alicyclobacillaceae bacterium]|nr:hypothetical protein [Alicyclobacillaceae bacterium]
MTTRFSLAELADMLNVPVQVVRRAVEALAREEALTAESFQYMDRNWRIAPSDVKRVQEWIACAHQRGQLEPAAVRRTSHVKRKQVLSDSGPDGV